MEKKLLLLLALLILPSVLAINLEVEQLNSKDTMIIGLNQPAIFNLRITNLEASENFEFFNLGGFNMVPKKTPRIKEGESEEIELKVYPREDLSIIGFYTLPYSLKGIGAEISNHELNLKIVDIEEVFDIGVENFDESSNEIRLFIRNKENFDFENITVEFSSAFFNTKEQLSLGAKERESFNLQLNREDFNKLSAGFYTMKAEIEVEDQKVELEGTIKFEEIKDLQSETKSYGFFINTKIIEKKNKGNSIENTQVSIDKNIISRLFTTLSPEPDIIERDDLKITYIWERSIKPGETLEIKVKTNWFFPLIILILLLVIVGILKHFARKDLVLRKKVTFVHSKGGEFALKVSVFVQAKKYVEKVTVIDRIPQLVKLYNRFGGQDPTRVNKEKRRIEWNFEKLEQGETRLVSYVIYSKIGVIGKFALPTATAIYEKEGELKESESNHVYFMAEPVQEKGKSFKEDED